VPRIANLPPIDLRRRFGKEVSQCGEARGLSCRLDILSFTLLGKPSWLFPKLIVVVGLLFASGIYRRGK
jgi:hypothetical protein